MDFCFATFAALFLLFAAASCAPVQDACVGVQRSSLELNHIAKIVSVEARNGSKHVADFNTSLVWMDAGDKCDPETLKQKPAPCVGKILDVLTRYRSAVERVAAFPSCSQFASRVTPAMHKLHEDMTKCVKSRANHQEESHDSIKDWQEGLLCQYTMDRLFSFSILTARVFAVGDPAHHAEGSAQKCM